jgi:hypothetical protein
LHLEPNGATVTPILLDDALTANELREANSLTRVRRHAPATTITRRYTFDEAVAALHHVRYDFTDEPAKGILYTLTERFKLTVTGAEYAVSYDAGDGMFFATFSGMSVKTILIHEANAGQCWCLDMRSPLCGCTTCNCLARYCFCSCCCGK